MEEFNLDLEKELVRQDELRLIVKIARLHYQEGWLQRRISNELGLSTAKVSTLLSKAVEKGLVKIHIHDPFAQLSKLEDRIKTEYGLNYVNIVPGPFPDANSLKAKLGLHAALYLQKILRKGHIVGITGGTTINAMVTSKVFNTYIPIMVIPINGGISQSEYHFTGNGHAAKLANQLGGSYLQVPFPTFVSSPDTRTVIIKDRSASGPLEQVKKADVIAFGIGTASTALLTLPHISMEEEQQELQKKGVVAEIGGHFLDENGVQVQTGFEKKLIGIELGDIKRVPMVIAVAGGIEKSNAIRSVLLSGVANALIIDEPTALRLFKD